ncbi:MAG: hypothetical protein EOO13_00495 [Chitinophagaceae bacterium]|nr:MAG: hypothetical protein EOO13_00495 [Chitinophagaceae bacterium]
MKKTIIIFSFFIAASLAVHAQADSSGTNYRFYPEVNVYFNPNTKTYSWFDQNRSSWTTGIQLPLSMKVKDENTFNTIRYEGTDVWSANADHIKIYGAPPAPAMPKTTNKAPEKPLPPPAK